VVDIKSKLLKEALNEVMDGVKGVSLVEETPCVDPNLLFLYLEDLRKVCKELKNKKITTKKGKKKAKKRNETKRKHLKVLLKYLDKDYSATKKTLYPMLESGLITFDLLWALYKPNTLAYTTTYGSVDEPRAFKIELAEKEFSFLKGEWYNIEGKYLEYDGKTWGMGESKFLFVICSSRFQSFLLAYTDPRHFLTVTDLNRNNGLRCTRIQGSSQDHQLELLSSEIPQERSQSTSPAYRAR
jgi:hypothetical protein